MPGKKLTAYVFCLICFASCINIFLHNKTSLWFYTYSSGETSSEFALTPASFLYLNPNNTYTVDFGEFEYGKWTKHGDTLTLHSSGGKINNYLVNYESNKDLKLSITPQLVSDFEGAAAKFSTEAENPFSLQNNKWRIPAKHKETPAEIKERLINHCMFWKTYFVWALNNNIDYVDVRSTPTPIKIYGNGFALKELNDLSVRWKNYFFDSADCRLANRMIEDIFTHENIAWLNGDNKYKMFAGAFEQLENFLRKENLPTGNDDLNFKENLAK
jgi:hypothetical protein